MAVDLKGPTNFAWAGDRIEQLGIGCLAAIRGGPSAERGFDPRLGAKGRRLFRQFRSFG
jgi:hypothetical protein